LADFLTWLDHPALWVPSTVLALGVLIKAFKSHRVRLKIELDLNGNGGGEKDVSRTAGHHQ